jgi:sialate O-acetylesterase
MEWGFLGVPSGPIDAKTANFPQIRLFSVDKRTAAKPQVNFKGSNAVNGAKGWVVCSPVNLTKVGTHSGSFSASGLYFGRELQAKLGIPVGLVQAAWGGTCIEPWTPRVDPAKGDGAMYNAMIAPMTPMTIRGTIWYQGESNLGDKGAYEQKMTELISSWRRAFQRPDMPFYFVEIAPYRYKRGDESALGELRAAQARVAVSVPHSGMIHTLDNPNDIGNIHPINKLQIGERLARLALAKTYGVTVGKSVVGPAFAAAVRDGAGVLVSFTETADALVTVDAKPPVGFEGLLADGKWAPASAEIRGDKVWVSVTGQKLSAVRFCWLETQQTNLRNAEGFPPSPFNAVLPKVVE